MEKIDIFHEEKTLPPIKGVHLNLIKSSRAKNISISPKPDKNEIRLTYPQGLFAKSQAMKFLEQKQNWLWQIFNKYKSNPATINLSEITFGTKVNFFGKTFSIEQANSRGENGLIDDENKIIYIAGEETFVTRRFKTICKNELEKYVKEKVKENYAKLEKLLPTFSLRKINKIIIKDTSSRWGSCASSGNISFAFKLYKHDYETINYVVCHELCHLKEMNHSKAFWDLVKALYAPNSITHAKSKLKGIL